MAACSLGFASAFRAVAVSHPSLIRASRALQAGCWVAWASAYLLAVASRLMTNRWMIREGCPLGRGHVPVAAPVLASPRALNGPAGRQLRVALVGLGPVAQTHLRLARWGQDSALAALCLVEAAPAQALVVSVPVAVCLARLGLADARVVLLLSPMMMTSSTTNSMMNPWVVCLLRDVLAVVCLVNLRAASVPAVACPASRRGVSAPAVACPASPAACPANGLVARSLASRKVVSDPAAACPASPGVHSPADCLVNAPAALCLASRKVVSVPAVACPASLPDGPAPAQGLAASVPAAHNLVAPLVSVLAGVCPANPVAHSPEARLGSVPAGVCPANPAAHNPAAYPVSVLAARPGDLALQRAGRQRRA